MSDPERTYHDALTLGHQVADRQDVGLEALDVNAAAKIEAAAKGFPRYLHSEVGLAAFMRQRDRQAVAHAAGEWCPCPYQPHLTTRVRYVPTECRYCARYGKACGRPHPIGATT